jgi:hypothetical protein
MVKLKILKVMQWKNNDQVVSYNSTGEIILHFSALLNIKNDHLFMQIVKAFIHVYG